MSSWPEGSGPINLSTDKTLTFEQRNGALTHVLEIKVKYTFDLLRKKWVKTIIAT